MTQPPKNPSNWDDYHYGSTPHRDSTSSVGRGSVRGSVRFESPERDHSPGSGRRVGAEEDHHAWTQSLRQRRSSVGLRLNALAHVGGVNSIENFARSWQRAAGFHEVTPARTAFVLSGEDDNTTEDRAYSRSDVEAASAPRTSLLRQHLEAASEDVIVEGNEDVQTPKPSDHADKQHLGSEASEVPGSMRHSVQGTAKHSLSIFNLAPHLATPLAGSYGTSYGTLRSTLNESSMVHAGELWRRQQETGDTQPDGERAPLIVKEVEQDGKVVLVIAGQSTLPQTVFNSTNVLIGVGLLSLPLGIKYAGWVCGMSFLLAAALITAYTAQLLSKCMDADPSLITFADLAFISYGQKARIATSILFTLELIAANVALVVLFADTLDILVPGIGVPEWKIISGLLLIPLNFAPLRILSFTSVLGIFSCFSIVLLIFVDGFIKPDTPGSLRQPALTHLFPSNWLTLPLSFGLLMSPWGGASVFPNIYRDMRHPYKYKRAVKITFSFTYILDTATAVAGLLMFGDGVMDEITSNIIRISGYPPVINVMISVFIAIIPLTKVPLNARPIISTIEVLTGLDGRAVSDAETLIGMSAWTRGLLKLTIRIAVVVVFVVIAILLPSFDSIMAFMGSTLCFTICIILPCMFYLKIFGKEVGKMERWWCYFLIVSCSILAIVGTVAAFVPKSLIGAE